VQIAKQEIAAEHLLRARLFARMTEVVRQLIIPALTDGEAIDNAEHLLHTLALLAVENGWSDAENAAFGSAAGVAIPAGLGATPWETAVAMRANLAQIPNVVSLMAERELQAVIGARRDALLEQPTSAAQAPEDSEADTARQFTAYLHARFGNAAELVDLSRIPGGRSKETFLLTLRNVGSLPEKCVLRVDRRQALMATRCSDEFRLLAEIAKDPEIKVPRPLLAEAEGSELGRTFMILEFVSGRKAGEYFPELYPLPEGIEAITIHAARILGRLHSKDATRHGFSAEPVSPDALRDIIENTYARARESGLRAAEFEAAYRWLKEHVRAGEGESTLTHGDFGLHNMLVEHGQITALLDWELAGSAVAASDLASFRHVVDLVGNWDNFIAAYVEAGGPVAATEPKHLDFHTVLRQLRINQTSFRCREIFREGHTNDFVLANAGFDMCVRTRRLLTETMTRLAAG